MPERLHRRNVIQILVEDVVDFELLGHEQLGLVLVAHQLAEVDVEVELEGALLCQAQQLFGQLGVDVQADQLAAQLEQAQLALADLFYGQVRDLVAQPEGHVLEEDIEVVGVAVHGCLHYAD